MKTSSQAFGDRIRAERKRLGYSQRDLAEHLKVSPATIALWEKGDIAEINADNLLKLALEFNVNPYWLLYGEDNHQALPDLPW